VVRGSCSSPVGEHQKTVDPIWPTARGLCLAALPPWHQLEGGADLPPSTPLIGVARRSIRALCESLMARTHVLVERLDGRHLKAVRQGRGRRGSLRPGFARCQTDFGVVVRGAQSCRPAEAGQRWWIYSSGSSHDSTRRRIAPGTRCQKRVRATNPTPTTNRLPVRRSAAMSARSTCDLPAMPSRNSWSCCS
jgi:hypothetical protein